ncbi:iron-containing redox enzyme family protein [Xenorhabdus bovienii]|uniref:Iron-containing redox enzyme family protein n=1 Tax=Xenorhabdus bovienii TaxID=40576 RepID=A0AAJ1J8A6_XENBV|nr:iron-containing redox enzyme family protein [Xenorhabdus bovienii]MDE1478769.1 iron-containing redox enzyme family protein [Xenorhabdus bovienii]MDE1491003.1 iron-containing redox enzyme family protein [Xenorhabdus bovienii]MDE9510406.1 iron-containing redox enzyme family protein [Xenorhabdus bovienii]MDE9522047.1 iron-containing redox enzyme family protein [Xenorhabdus bovienii]
MNKKSIRDYKKIENFNDINIGRDAILAFADSEQCIDNGNRYEEQFYGRRIRPHVLKYIDFSSHLTRDNISTYSAFAANRTLFTMNEMDFLMLTEMDKFIWEDYQKFYSDERFITSNAGIRLLEKYLFSFLDDEIIITENWNKARVKEYFFSFADESLKCSSLPSANAILTSTDPVTTSKDWLIQLATDFLIESSPMARYASGSYGEIASSLFKIIIDELGYGDFSKHHATLYRDTLNSVNLNSTPHYYWQYYLNGSLLLANYYNMVTKDKRKFFRYIGAIYQAETSFITSCKIWRNALKETLPNINVKYFNEHCHIDIDHSRMVFEGLVSPAIDKYGQIAATEIIRGFEEACLISDISEQDFIRQIEWKDNAETYKHLHDRIIIKVKEATNKGIIPCVKITEPYNELSITHSHDSNELCHVKSGTMEFLNGFEKSTILNAGEGIIIEHNRLHGALIKSESCDYEIYTIGDLTKWE